MEEDVKVLHPSTGAAAIAAMLLLAACGGGSSGAASTPRSSAGASAASGASAPAGSPLAGQPAGAIMTEAIGAVRAAGSVRAVAHTASGSKTITFIDDISAAGGRELIATSGGGQATFLLIAGVGYLRGNAAALENYYGFPASAATQLSGRWISFRQGDQGYQQLTSQLRFSYFIDEITLQAPLARRDPSLVGNRPVIGVQGTVSDATSAPSGGSATLYVASTGRPLPLSLIYDVKGIRSQVTFSNWGEAVKPAPPADSIPASSLSSPLPGHEQQRPSVRGRRSGSTVAPAVPAYPMTGPLPSQVDPGGYVLQIILPRHHAGQGERVRPGNQGCGSRIPPVRCPRLA